MHAILSALVLTTAAAAPLGGAPLELRYSGSVEPAENGGTPTKTFDLYCLLAGESGATHLTFVIDERGAGGWAWPERYGRLEASKPAAEDAPIQLLHEYDGTHYPLAVDSPLFAERDKLQAGAQWQSGDNEYEVAGSAKRAERECWRVAVRQNIGRGGTLWIEKETGLVVAAERRVFMGRGDEFRLTMELESAAPVAEDKAERLLAVAGRLVKLQADLARKVGATDPQLSTAQLETASAAAGELLADVADTPFERLVAAMDRDVKEQQERGAGVDALAQRYVGEASPELKLVGLDAMPVPADEYAGKIVVLHFWKYHDEPLTEPYGQVGYLDFLNGKREKLGVKTYGVAVDERLGSNATRGAAVRQIRKLQEFFNLGYTVTADDGKLLKAFGDPQRLGAALPLWVVIAPDGTVAHYKVGHYDIKPEEGLKPLDDVVTELIRKQRAGE